MSEKINLPHETIDVPAAPEQTGAAKTSEKKIKRTSHEHQPGLENISRKAEASAKASEELRQITDTEKPEKPSGKFAPGKQLRQNTLDHSLRKVRRDLKPYQRPLSKFIHNDVVEAVSEFSEKTIARPSGLLAGGITSFLVSIAVLWMCRYFGYEYNYYVGIVSFAAGFIIGIVGEFITKPLRRD